MYSNKDMLNLVILNGTEYVLSNAVYDNIEDQGLKDLFKEYFELRRKIATYIVDAVDIKDKSPQEELSFMKEEKFKK